MAQDRQPEDQPDGVMQIRNKLFAGHFHYAVTLRAL